MKYTWSFAFPYFRDLEIKPKDSNAIINGLLFIKSGDQITRVKVLSFILREQNKKKEPATEHLTRPKDQKFLFIINTKCYTNLLTGKQDWGRA